MAGVAHLLTSSLQVSGPAPSPPVCTRSGPDPSEAQTPLTPHEASFPSSCLRLAHAQQPVDSAWRGAGPLNGHRSIGNDLLSNLADSCTTNILSRLSPEDLCSLAQVSAFFRSAASDPALWRALYFARWSSGPSDVEQDGQAQRDASWKMMYMERDAMELKMEAEKAPEAFRDIYLQMVTARRSEPLSSAAAAELLAAPSRRQGVLSDRIAAFRRDRGLSGTSTSQSPGIGPSSGSGGSGVSRDENGGGGAPCSNGCNFVELERNVWICETGGHVHRCGAEACGERQAEKGSDLLVCRITGRCFQQMVSEVEDAAGDAGGREGDDAGFLGDWNTAEEGMGGRLGRAFFAGYHAADEQEMLMRFGVKL